MSLIDASRFDVCSVCESVYDVEQHSLLPGVHCIPTIIHELAGPHAGDMLVRAAQTFDPEARILIRESHHETLIHTDDARCAASCGRVIFVSRGRLYRADSFVCPHMTAERMGSSGVLIEFTTARDTLCTWGANFRRPGMPEAFRDFLVTKFEGGHDKPKPAALRSERVVPTPLLMVKVPWNRET